MPAWISVYCTQAVGEIKPGQLLEDIRDNDFWTLAEQYDVDEDLVDPALAQLRLVPDKSGFELHYRAEGERPLVIHYWAAPERVEEEIDEVLESLDGAAGAPRIADHMQKVQAVIGIEMGASQLTDMGVVLAYEIARWFGSHRGGLIKGDDDNWSLIEDGGYVRL